RAASLVPDVSLIWPDQRVDGWYQSSPMLAIEIASRGNQGQELETKTKLYLKHGAAEVWILYPETRTMVVSRAGTNEVLRIQEGESYVCTLVGITVVSNFWVPVG